MWLVSSRPAAGNRGRSASSRLPRMRGRAGRRVEHVLELRLDEGALLLDDEDGLQPIGEAARTLRLQRKRHCHLVEPGCRAAAPPPRRCRGPRTLGGRRGRTCRWSATPNHARSESHTVRSSRLARQYASHRFQLALVEPRLLLLLASVRPADSEALSAGRTGSSGMTIPDPLQGRSPPTRRLRRCRGCTSAPPSSHCSARARRRGARSRGSPAPRPD